MSKVKLDLSGKPDGTVLMRMTTHMGAMDTPEGMANFASPTPAKMVGIGLQDAFAAAIEQADLAEAAWKLKVSLKNDARASVVAFLDGRASYVDDASGGDATKILSAGFDVRATAAPIGPMPAPLHLMSTMGDMTGEIDLQWDPIKGAKTYIVECRLHSPVGTWAQAKISTSSRTSVLGLVPGQEYAFRVQALGAAGPGPWSDESVKMAPA